MAVIGFIGMGNMGYALLKGLLKEFPAEELVFTAKTDETRRRVYAETQVTYTPVSYTHLDVYKRQLDVVLMGFNPRLGLLEYPSGDMKERARKALALSLIHI